MSIKVQICTPVPNEQGALGWRRGRFTFEWMKARLELVCPLTTTLISRWELGYTIDDARNHAAQAAVDQGMDYLFFLDWDTILHPQTLHQLVQRALNNPDHDVFSAVYCCRHRDYPAPLIYVGDDFKLSWDWTVGDVLTTDEHGITGFGCGAMLIRTSLLKKMSNTPEKPWFKTTPDMGCGGETEDLYFLNRARKEHDSKFLVDTGLLAWHIDPDTGVASNLPHDSLPIKRWRARNPHIPPHAVPYDVSGFAMVNIGQQVTQCSENALPFEEEENGL